MKNKKAWIRIVEASVAILFLAGIALLILNQGIFQSSDDSFSENIHETQLQVLRDIQTNETLRESVISIEDNSLPLEWNDQNFPNNVKNKIESSFPASLNCEANICSVEDSCLLESPVERDIYSEFIILSVTTNQNPASDYSFKKFKLFCWESE